jgi:hypothetical protein
MDDKERLEEMKQLFDDKDIFDDEILGKVKQHFYHVFNLQLDIRRHFTTSHYGSLGAAATVFDPNRNFVFLGVRKGEEAPCLILASYAGIKYKPTNKTAWIEI